METEQVSLSTVARDLLVVLALLWERSQYTDVSWKTWLNSIAEVSGNQLRYHLCTMQQAEEVWVDPFYWSYADEYRRLRAREMFPLW